jgi:hypothetical protein
VHASSANLGNKTNDGDKINGTRTEGSQKQNKLVIFPLAKEIGAGPNGARHCTGTMEFMAIEVLEGISQPQKYSKCWLSEAAPPTAEVVLHPY